MLEIIREEKLKDIFGNNVYRFNKFVYIIKYFIIIYFWTSELVLR